MDKRYPKGEYGMKLEQGMLVRYKAVANLPWLPEYGIGIIVKIEDDICLVYWQNNTLYKEWINDLEACE